MNSSSLKLQWKLKNMKLLVKYFTLQHFCLIKDLQNGKTTLGVGSNMFNQLTCKKKNGV